MRLLAASDIHGSTSMLKSMLERENADLLVLAGDLSNNSMSGARRILQIAGEYEMQVVFVPGNMDPPDLLYVKSLEGAINLHGRVRKVLGLNLGGLGGGGISPFNTPIEFDEATLWKKLSDLAGIDILVSHVPPYGTKLDVVRSGVHVGSKSLLKFLKEKQPILCICGHIHESHGIDLIGRTVSVNPGPLMWGRYAVIEVIDGNVKPILKKIS